MKIKALLMILFALTLASDPDWSAEPKWTHEEPQYMNYDV